MAELTAVHGTVYFLHETTLRPLESRAQLRRQLEADGIVELVCGDRAAPFVAPSPRPRFVYRAACWGKDQLRRFRPPAMNYVHEPSYDACVDIDVLTAPCGSTTTVPLHVRNRCAHAMVLEHVRANPIFVSYHWLDAHGAVIEADGLRTAFARPLAPGRRATVEMRVRMPEEVGEYVLVCALVQEGFAWFDQLRPELATRVAARAT